MIKYCQTKLTRLEYQVWKGTTQVGCAVVKCPAGSVIPKWVSHFDDQTIMCLLLTYNQSAHATQTSVTDYVVCEYNPPGNYAGQYGTNVGKRV